MKTLKGEVISVEMAKTAVVGVHRTKIHHLYQKRIRRIKKYHVHDEIGVKKGDQVEFRQVRPISKTKKWMITKIIEKTRLTKAVPKKKK